MDMHANKIEAGSVKIHKNVIASIAAFAALEITGVKHIGKPSCIAFLEFFGLKASRLIKVEFGRNGEIRLEVPLVVAYGCTIASVVESVQDNIRRSLEKMLDKSPRDIRINVQGIEK